MSCSTGGFYFLIVKSDLLHRWIQFIILYSCEWVVTLMDSIYFILIEWVVNYGFYLFYFTWVGSAPSTQRSWGSSSDRSKVESSWSASRQQMDSRGSGSQQQDRWAGGSLGLQTDARQQTFSTQMAGGILAAGVPNMLLTSVPQAAGMVLTNTSLTRGQTEPRFDAYKSMQTQFRRY